MNFKESLEILLHDHTRFMDEKLVDAKIENGNIVFKTHPDMKRQNSQYNEKDGYYYWKIKEIIDSRASYSIPEKQKYLKLIIKERIRKIK